MEKINGRKMKFVLIITILCFGCVSNINYKINITKSINTDIKNFPPEFEGLYNINNLSKDNVIEEIKNAKKIKTYYSHKAEINLEYIENNYYLVIDKLISSKKQFTKNELIEKIISMKLFDDTM